VDILKTFKSAFTLFEQGRPEPETKATRLRRLITVRNLARLEFGFSLLASILLPIGLVMMGPGALEMLSAVWYFIIAPAMFSGAAMLVYYSRGVNRPWSETLGELAFWVTFPVGATIFLFALQWQGVAAL